MRLDYYIAHAAGVSRKEAKQAISRQLVLVNGEAVKKINTVVGPDDTVLYQGLPLLWPQERYYMLHKPAHYVCATQDAEHPIVLDLLPLSLRKDLKIVGRLDKDTTGLLLLTTDGKWLHKITSPRSNCQKVYRVRVADPLTPASVTALTEGVMLHGETQPTLAVATQILDDFSLLLTLNEGKYHQVKRMLAAVGNRVTDLHRQQIGPLCLEDSLPESAFRALTAEEVAALVER